MLALVNSLGILALINTFLTLAVANRFGIIASGKFSILLALAFSFGKLKALANSSKILAVVYSLGILASVYSYGISALSNSFGLFSLPKHFDIFDLGEFSSTEELLPVLSLDREAGSGNKLFTFLMNQNNRKITNPSAKNCRMKFVPFYVKSKACVFPRLGLLESPRLGSPAIAWGVFRVD
ncbi:hypothetical protein M0802_011343 [Mischocyttarus mexicanus]|nr:hypothetical protein M0802_011343 [Mischocyttarus mexicanus]